MQIVNYGFKPQTNLKIINTSAVASWQKQTGKKRFRYYDSSVVTVLISVQAFLYSPTTTTTKTS